MKGIYYFIASIFWLGTLSFSSSNDATNSVKLQENSNFSAELNTIGDSQNQINLFFDIDIEKDTPLFPYDITEDSEVIEEESFLSKVHSLNHDYINFNITYIGQISKQYYDLILLLPKTKKYLLFHSLKIFC